jgi:hypothetical protein
VGYAFGIRSERVLCRKWLLNRLAENAPMLVGRMDRRFSFPLPAHGGWSG